MRNCKGKDENGECILAKEHPERFKEEEMESIIIGFDGASGGGKTTTVKEAAKVLRREGYSVGVVTEVVREVFEEFREQYDFKNLSEIRASSELAEFQRECLSRQYYLENYMLERYEVVLSDRTLFGNEFFTLFYCKDSAALNSYIRMLRDYIKLRKLYFGKVYDAVVIFPPLPESINVDDGFRTSDLNYREVQTYVIGQLASSEVNRIYELKTFDLRERVEFIRDLVDYLIADKILA